MKNTQRVNVVTMKQQVSKVLLSQLKADLKNCSTLEEVDRSYMAKLVKSGYRVNHSLASFSRCGVYNIHFEWGHRGGVRVSYVNSDGLISATFQPDEWGCIKFMLQDLLDDKICGIKAANEEKERKEEQERFEARVAAAVHKELYKQMAEKDLHDAMAKICHMKVSSL